MGMSKTENLADVPSDFNRSPLLWSKDHADVQLMAAINLSDETAVKKWIDSFEGHIPSRIGLEILNIWKGCRDILISLTRKIELDDIGFKHLSEIEDLCARREFVKRDDLSSADLKVLVRPYLTAPGRTEIAVTMLGHQNCNADVLTEMWSIASLRAYLLRRQNLPKDFQKYVADNGDYAEKNELMKQPNTDTEIRKFLAESFASENCEYTQADLLLYCDVQSAQILSHAFSTNLRLATLAADRLSEAASLLKIRDYVHWHAGFRFAPIQTLVAVFIRDGLPLGWFVCACFVLRRIITNDPDTFYKLLLWVKSEPRAAGLRSISYSSEKDIRAFDRLLASLTPEQKARLGIKTLQLGYFDTDLLKLVRATEEGYDAGFMLDQSSIRRTTCLRVFVDEYIHQFNVSREESVRFRPTVRPYWAWLSRLEDQVLSSGHRVRVIRTSRSLRRLGASLRNCLNKEYDFYRIRKGKTIVLSLQKDNRDMYAVEIQTEKCEISQFYGIHNSSPPEEVTQALRDALATAKLPPTIN